jgi:hypothetical protein
LNKGTRRASVANTSIKHRARVCGMRKTGYRFLTNHHNHRVRLVAAVERGEVNEG